MGTSPNPNSGVPDFSPDDLKDPTLFKLNTTVRLLWGKVANLYQSGLKTALGADILAPSFTATNQSTPPPAGSSVLISRATADTLYAPSTQRTALISGAYQSVVTQPITTGGSGNSGNPVSFIEASDYCGGMGLSDICINNAIAYVATIGGGAIHLKSGTWAINAPVNANTPNVILFGDGNGTILLRGSNMPANKAMIDVTADGWTLQNFLLDGNVSSPAHLLYNTPPPTGFQVASPEDGTPINYPLASTLTLNTSVWLHGKNNFKMFGMTIQRSGGYSVIVDASTVSINNVTINECSFINNKPHLFGTSSLDINYGAYTSGVVAIGGTYQGGAGTLTFVSGFVVTDCYWYANNGNCLWSWAPQLTVNHNRFVWSNNTFQDCGLDGIQPGAAQGGVVSGNTFYRVGYINGNPKYLTGLNATALDSTGFVRSFSYADNTIINTNGDGIDLDNFCEGTVSGNSIFISPPSDYYYTVDQVASYGPTGGPGNIGNGIICNDSFDIRGANDVSITGNTIRNMGVSAIIVFNNRNSSVIGNNINHPGTALGPPIDVANISITGTVTTIGTAVVWGSGTQFSTQWVDSGYIFIFINSVRYEIASVSSPTTLTLKTSAGAQSGVAYAINKCQNNTIANNAIYYNATQWSIVEDNTYGALTGPNFYYGNRCVGATFGEVLISNAAGNTSQANFVFSTNSPSATSQSSNYIQREGFSTTAAFKLYSLVGGVSQQLLQVSDSGFLNVSVAGAANTGVLATGNRSSTVFNDTVVTGVPYGDRFLALTDSTFTYPNDPDADALSTNAWGLIRYNSTTHAFEQSISVSGGHRVWSSFGGGGTPGGTDTDIQYNKTGAFAGDSNLTWNYTTQVATITGIASTAALNVLTGYINTTGGLVTNVNSWQAVNSLLDGALLRGYGLAPTSANKGGYIDIAILGYANFPVPLVGLGSFGSGDVLLWASGTNGTVTLNNTNSLMSNSAFNSAVGFASSNTASNTVNIPNGGVTALSLISIRNDGVSGITIDRTSATARQYGFAINSGGSLLLNDDTASAIRMSVSTVGLFSWGATVNIDQSGNFTWTGLATGSGGSSALSVQGTAFNAIQAIAGGIYSAGTTFGMTNDGPYFSKSRTSSLPSVSAGYSAIQHNSGALWNYYDTGLAAWEVGQFFPTGAWTSFSTSSSNITISSQVSKYLLVGKTCFVRISVTGVYTGTSGNYAGLALPFSMLDPNQTFAGYSINSLSSFGVTTEVVGLIGTAIVVGQPSGYANGNTYTIIVQGVYEIS